MSYFEKTKLTIYSIILILAAFLGIWVLHKGLSQISSELRDNNKKLDQISNIKSTMDTVTSAREE